MSDYNSTFTENTGDTIDTSDFSTEFDAIETAVATKAEASVWTDAGEAHDTNGNEVIILGTTASAVNEVTVTNAATGNDPSIAASGETNVGLQVTGKGNKLAYLAGRTTTISGGATNAITMSNIDVPADTSIKFIFYATSGASSYSLDLVLNGDATATNYYTAAATDGGAYAKANSNALNGMGIPSGTTEPIMIEITVHQNSTEGAMFVQLRQTHWNQSVLRVDVGFADVYYGTSGALTSLSLSVNGGANDLNNGTYLTMKTW